tara:strand:- start:203 stop:391 length:189 start_codon:yes stop_codon:yes gene_type:complete
VLVVLALKTKIKMSKGKDFWNQKRNGITGFRIYTHVTAGQTKLYRKVRIEQRRKAKEDENNR